MGSWWLALSLLALVGAVLYILECEILPISAPAWRTVQIWDRQGVWRAVNPVFVSVATTTWLLYVLKAHSLVSSLVDNTTSVSLPKLRSWLFRLAITSGVICWVSIAGMELLQALVREHHIMGGGRFAGRCVSVAAAMLWIAALVSLGNGGRLMAVLWHVSFNVFPALGWLLTVLLDDPLHSIWGTHREIAVESPAAESLLLLLALALAYVVILLAARGQRAWALALTAVVAASMLVNGLDAWTGVPLVDTAAYCCGWMVYRASLEPLRLFWEHSTMQLWIAGIRLDIPCSLPLETAVEHVWCVWPVIHFLAIGWILRRVLPRGQGAGNHAPQ